MPASMLLFVSPVVVGCTYRGCISPVEQYIKLGPTGQVKEGWWLVRVWFIKCREGGEEDGEEEEETGGRWCMGQQ